MGYVLTIGSFDGVHLGHQALLQRTSDAARELGLRPTALTFYPHPRSVLHPDHPVTCLMTLRARLRTIRGYGMREILALRFDRQMARMSAREFFEAVGSRLDVRRVVVGESFRAGRNREAGAPELARLGKELGWRLETVPTLQVEGAPVSSTRIREALSQAGDAALARQLLGRPFELPGTVVRGAGRGRTIGVPTANLLPTEGLVVPANGVYYCLAAWGEAPQRDVAAVVNIGIRPTFDAGARSVEAHLPGWSGELYGRQLRLKFLARLRPERKFSGVTELQAQIRTDIEHALELHHAATS